VRTAAWTPAAGVGLAVAVAAGLLAWVSAGAEPGPGGVAEPAGQQAGEPQAPGRQAPGQRAAASAPAQAPTTLPATTLTGFDDSPPVETSDYRGRPLVVNFWATWCGPCRQEMPAFQQVAEQTEQVAFLGVDVQDAPAKATDFVERLGIRYDLATDRSGDFYNAVGAFGMPTTLFVDASGTIVARHTGALTAEALRDKLRTELSVQL
jgi:thiol-disulfide isomerase/thioredoxin